MATQPSLVRRLLWTLVGSLTAVALLLGTGGAWLINRIVEGTADRLLGASARAIAETLAVEDGEITLDLPPFALGMLENNARDNVYYSVRRGPQLITGYPDLPFGLRTSLEPEEIRFRYERYRGSRIRIAAEARSLPRIRGLIVVQVAETLDARRELARRMLVGLVVLEGVLVGVAALLVWPVVQWGMRPVTRLTEQIEARPASRADFTPLPMADVPRELTGLVAGFNELLHRLESSVEGMRRFTADASHQMRTPLAILRTHLALLRKHGTGKPAGRASLVDIEHATDRLQGLLTGLITLARAEDAPQEAVAPVDLCATAQAAVADSIADAAAAQIELRFEASDRPILAPADRILLTEILQNLIGNALRYCGPGGRVVVSVRESADGPAIVVEDDGPGIPEADRTRVLERFYRLPRDQAQAGSGLGLSIVDALARRIGATFELGDGANGNGLRVQLSLRGSRTGAEGGA